MGAVQKFLRSEDGSIAVFAGLTVVILCGVIGLAVDSSRTLNAKTKLQGTADAAALAAAAAFQINADTVGKAARNFIDANLAISPDITNAQHEITLNDTKTEVQVVSRADVPTSFLQIFGVTAMTTSVTSTASLGAGYLDIYLILDISASIDRAATAADVAQLKALTKLYTDAQPGIWEYAENGCAFACHTRSNNNWEPPGKTAYEFARENGVLLRSDVLLSASKALVGEVLSDDLDPVARERLRIGVLAFDDVAYKIGDPSSEADSVNDMLDEAVGRIFSRDTRYDDVMSRLSDWVGTSGDGKTRDTAKKIAVIVTDGLETIEVAQDVMSADNCNLFKNNGVTLGVVELKYLEDPDSPQYMGRVSAYFDQISPALTACASTPELHFQGDAPAEISTAFGQLAKAVTERVIALAR